MIEIKLVYCVSWDEYQVQYFEDGVLNEARTYNTDDYEDAVATQIQTLKDLKK